MASGFGGAVVAMIRICATTLISLLLSFTSVAAQHMDKTMFLDAEVTGDREQRALLKVYFLGILNGLEASNMDLLRQGRPPLFCPPPSLTLTPELLTETLLVYLKRYPAIPNNLSIAVIANNALAEQFSCERRIHY